MPLHTALRAVDGCPLERAVDRGGERIAASGHADEDAVVDPDGRDAVAVGADKERLGVALDA